MKFRLDIQLFGGRGAGTGREGGGGGNITIMETDSLVSRRNSDFAGQEKLVDDTLETTQWYKDNYGSEAFDLQVAKLSDKDDATMGFCDQGGTVSINELYFDDEAMNKAMDECVNSGWHPSRGNKTGLQATIAHEMGHVMNHRIADFIGQEYSSVATDIVTESRKLIGVKGNVIMGRGISRYATVNNKETLAEAYADYYCNGKKASINSRAIVYTIANKLSKYAQSGVATPTLGAYFTESEINNLRNK